MGIWPEQKNMAHVERGQLLGETLLGIFGIQNIYSKQIINGIQLARIFGDNNNGKHDIYKIIWFYQLS